MRITMSLTFTRITVLGTVLCYLSSDVHAQVRDNDWKDLLLTGAEKQALDQLKAKVAPHVTEAYMKTDFYLIRWVRATNLNVGAAQKLVMDMLKWRQEKKIDKIRDEDWSDMRQDFPVAFEGHDKRGRPVATMDMGEWDIRNAVLKGQLPRLLRFMDWFQEELVFQILEAQNQGKNVTRGVLLVDIDGFNLLQHFCPSCITVFIRMTQGSEAHYPGFWDQILVLNAPSGSRVGMDGVRPVASKNVQEVLKIFDRNKKQWMSYLDERISRDQRTPRYGGTKRPNEI